MYKSGHVGFTALVELHLGAGGWEQCFFFPC